MNGAMVVKRKDSYFVGLGLAILGGLIFISILFTEAMHLDGLFGIVGYGGVISSLVRGVIGLLFVMIGGLLMGVKPGDVTASGVML